MKITKIEPKRYQKSIFCVFVDNLFWADVLDESIIKLGIQTQKEFEQTALQALFEQTRLPLAMHYASKFVLRRGLVTQKELDNFLDKHGFSSQIRQCVTKRMKEYRYINDQDFAKRFVERNLQKGKHFFRFALKQKGIDEQIINHTLSQLPNQQEIIFNLAKKYLKNKDIADFKVRQKCFAHLANKGFEIDDIKLVIEHIKGAPDEYWD